MFDAGFESGAGDADLSHTDQPLLVAPLSPSPHVMDVQPKSRSFNVGKKTRLAATALMGVGIR